MMSRRVERKALSRAVADKIRRSGLPAPSPSPEFPAPELQTCPDCFNPVSDSRRSGKNTAERR